VTGYVGVPGSRGGKPSRIASVRPLGRGPEGTTSTGIVSRCSTGETVRPAPGFHVVATSNAPPEVLESIVMVLVTAFEMIV